ncbi:DUF2805 domain-containing protein [Tenacibaculum maritimum]|nr:DUF2805 domain-containing protein [Tenacibaculum maritimum]QCD61912.1 hypothetical protein B9C57_04835 [Tenacibaculum maritimum]
MTEIALDRIIEIAEKDSTPFEAIVFQIEILEEEVIKKICIVLSKASFKH